MQIPYRLTRIDLDVYLHKKFIQAQVKKILETHFIPYAAGG